MLERWQFNVLFCVGVGGAILLLLGPEIGLSEVGKNPVALTGVGSILTYVLTQKRNLTKPPPDEKDPDAKKEDS